MAGMPGKSIVILGGTFDPVHLGHLRAAEEVREALGMDEFRLLPSGQPPHRDPPIATPAQRLEMLNLAINAAPGFSIDDRELNRPGPSYMVETLHSFREQYPDAALALLIGQDAANSLDRWYRWRELREFAHVVIMNRHGDKAAYSDQVDQFLSKGRVASPELLASRPAGCVLELAIESLPISASRIRHMIVNGQSVRFLLPRAVFEYIEKHGLYN